MDVRNTGRLPPRFYSVRLFSPLHLPDGLVHLFNLLVKKLPEL